MKAAGVALGLVAVLFVVLVRLVRTELVVVDGIPGLDRHGP